MSLSSNCNSRPRRVRFQIAAALAAAAFVLIVLGCMSFSVGGRTVIETPNDNPHEQRGEVDVRPGAELDVFYPQPYVRTPNLSISSTFDEIDLLEQHTDHFRVRNTDQFFRRTLSWKARGLIEGPPAPIPIAPQTPPPSSPIAPINPAPAAPVPYTPDH
jgi:hypothetical protein